MKLQPLTVGSTTYTCKNAAVWPPFRGIKLRESIEEQRAFGLIEDAEYEQLKTWQRVCGLAEMSEAKCPTCPYVLVNGKPVGDNRVIAPPANREREVKGR